MQRVAKMLLALVVLVLFPTMCLAVYKVVPGDNLWSIADRCWGDPAGWRARLLDKNPELKTPGRIIERGPGDVLVLLNVGQTLVGAEGCIEGEPITLEQFLAQVRPQAVAFAQSPAPEEPKVEVLASPAAIASEQAKPSEQEDLVLWALWFQEHGYSLIWQLVWLLGIAAILVAIFIGYIGWRYRGALAPMVPGGIPVDQPALVEARFTQIAQRHLLAADPTAYLTLDNIVRTSPIEFGLANNKGEVEYRGGRPRRERFHNEPMYRATYRFPDGREEELLFKQICGNDVRIGTRYKGFRFTPISIVAPAPTVSTPTPALAPTPAAAPAPVPFAPTAPVASNGSAAVATTSVTVGGLTLSLPAGSNVQVGPDGHIVVVPAQVRSSVVDPAFVSPS